MLNYMLMIQPFAERNRRTNFDPGANLIFSAAHMIETAAYFVKINIQKITLAINLDVSLRKCIGAASESSDLLIELMKLKIIF